jgi:DNA-binding NtrC family response regulator
MPPASEAHLVAIVDDDPFLRRVTRSWFERRGYRVLEAASGSEALERISAEVALVCLDLGLEDLPGLDVLSHLRARGFEAPILVITAESAVATAVEAMRRGAYDYCVKPLDPERLLQIAERAIEHRDLAERVRTLQQEVDAKAEGEELVGGSEAMRALREKIDRVRGSDVTVCIRGESGSGKELVARAIHERSRRAASPFVAINCAAIPASLQESELFGHERGAFTGATQQHRGRFEQAHRGTLFLDEIGEMSPATQAALLRTLQERTIRRVGGTSEVGVDVRIVCATHRDLLEEVRAGRFREDLYFRLVVFPIDAPPLRARVDDVPLLVTHFLRRLRDDVGRSIERVHADALAALMRHRWPGNVRELQNVVHRAMLACDGDEIGLSHLDPDIRAGVLPALPAREQAPRSLVPISPADEIVPLRELERRAIVHALSVMRGNVERAAKALGMGRATLYRRLGQEGLDPRDPGAPSEEARATEAAE